MNRRALVVTLPVLVLAACTSDPSISTKAAPGANLAAYKTFAWVTSTPPANMNPDAFERMRQGIEQALSSKGYAKSDAGDMSLVLTVGAQDRTDITSWGEFAQPAGIYHYTEGRMALDVFDTKTRQPLWHGEATKAIVPRQTDPAVIDAAVSGVMAKFPPRA